MMINSINAMTRFGCDRCGNSAHKAGTPLKPSTVPVKGSRPVTSQTPPPTRWSFLPSGKKP